MLKIIYNQALLEKKADELAKIVKSAKRKLLEFDILLSQKELLTGKFTIYKRAKYLLREFN